jgi:hypothetical protein
MNLLTLQICKEEAEKMIHMPYSWLFNKEETLALEKIKDQGRRTLEVIEAYENRRKQPYHSVKEYDETIDEAMER